MVGGGKKCEVGSGRVNKEIKSALVEEDPEEEQG